MKKTTTKMMSGGKTSAKPKMAKGGAAPKKKYAMGSTVSNTEQCGPGNPKCKEGSYNKGRGTGKAKRSRGMISFKKV